MQPTLPQNRFRKTHTFMHMESRPANLSVIGIDYLTDSVGVRKSVVIDLERHGALLEDFFDVIASRESLAEGDFVSLEDFQNELIKEGRLDGKV